MSLFAPRTPQEAEWQKWNYGGGASRGEPMPQMSTSMSPFGDLMASAPAEGDWFAQFNTDNASANTGINGGATGAITPGQPTGGGDTSMGAFSQAWESSAYPGTVEGLKAFVAANPQYGVKIGGSKGDKIYGPDGQFWGDGVKSAGIGGGQGKLAFTGDQGGGAAGGMGAFGGLLAPYTDQFKLPTAEELKGMPGYQAALDAAMEGTQRSAASRGTLLTGGTQRALQQNAGTVASQMYGQLAGLQLGAQGFNRDSFYHNQDSPFSKLFSTTQLGMNASSQPTVGPTQQTGSGYQPPAAPVAPTTARPAPVGRAPRRS